MAQFFVDRAFQFGGQIRREGSTLTINNQELAKEIDLGKHPDTGKPLSGLLNHCTPDDDATAELCKDVIETKEIEAPPTEEEKAAEMGKIKKEFDALGVAYHPGWTLARLKKELVKAKKEKGA